MKYAILGGGLAGLATADLLKEKGKDIIVIEKEGAVGGLCRTNKTGPYLWDFAVHALYSRHKEMNDFLASLPIDNLRYDRDVEIIHVKNGRPYVIDYPFENGIGGLPFPDKWECIFGYIMARLKNNNDPSNLMEWINDFSGYGVAKHFMVPYNKKIWDCELSKMSVSLVNTKIEPAAICEFLASALGKKTLGRTYQSKFLYPRRGINELITYLAEKHRSGIFCNNEVLELKRDGKWKIRTSRGSFDGIDTVISTIPMVELLKITSIPGLEKGYKELCWNDTLFVMVGLKEDSEVKLIKTCQWAFFKGDEIFYRLTLMHNLIPQPCPSIVAEITRKKDVAHLSDAQIELMAVDDLARRGIINKNDVAVVTSKTVQYTYPIPTVGTPEIKEKISRELKKHGILPFGRNGNWDYINMDQVLMKARELIDRNARLFS